MSAALPLADFPPNQQAVVAATWEHVCQVLAAQEGSHDRWHVERVWRLADRLARAEGASRYVVALAALLHDIADWKFHAGELTAGPQAAGDWLKKQQVACDVSEHVCAIVAGVSFKGAGVATPMSTGEGRCVQDADRLDALGAIGIARTFAYGGHRGRPLYDPAQAPGQHADFAAYRDSESPSINHFYEKLLLLKDRMQTSTGRRWAAERHAFMEAYLERFYREWDGEV